MEETRLKSLRKQRGLTLQECAKVLGMSRQGYTKIERGVTELSVTNAKKLAEAFGVSLEEVVA